MPESTSVPEEALQLSNISTAGGLSALALVTASQLKSRGLCTLFVNAAGFVELLPYGEIELDLMPETEALQVLLKRGYTDSMLQAFLHGRDTRSQRRGG